MAERDSTVNKRKAAELIEAMTGITGSPEKGKLAAAQAISFTMVNPLEIKQLNDILSYVLAHKEPERKPKDGELPL